MPEQQNIEYKQSWHDDYMKWVCGFANAIGGMIYIGIDDKGNVVHLTDYAKLMEDIPNKIRNSMGIICDVQLEEKEDKNFISIKVNPYSVAVSLRGRYYYRTGSTNMEMCDYDDRLSIWNEGGLPFGLTLEELKGEHNSRPRNPKIAKACFMAGYIDTWGLGTLKIYNSCKEHGLPEPAILEKDGGFMVALYKTAQVTEEGGQLSGQIGGQMGGTIGGQIGGTMGGTMGGTIEDLTVRQREVLSFIKENNKLSVRKLAENLDINISAVQGHLDILKEKGIIQRIGGTRGYWKILIEQ